MKFYQTLSEYIEIKKDVAIRLLISQSFKRLLEKFPTLIFFTIVTLKHLDLEISWRILELLILQVNELNYRFLKLSIYKKLKSIA